MSSTIISLPNEIIRYILDIVNKPNESLFNIINSCKSINKLNYHHQLIPIKLFSYYICDYSHVYHSKNKTYAIKNYFYGAFHNIEYGIHEYLNDLKCIIDLVFLQKKNKKSLKLMHPLKKNIDKSPYLLVSDVYLKNT